MRNTLICNDSLTTIAGSELDIPRQQLIDPLGRVLPEAGAQATRSPNRQERPEQSHRGIQSPHAYGVSIGGAAVHGLVQGGGVAETLLFIRNIDND